MSLWKDLLIGIVLSSVMTTDSQPIRSVIQQLKLSLCNLKKAEDVYVKRMYGEDPPMDYKTNLKLIHGVTLPAGNSTAEIQASLCAINDYLENHLPSIIRNLTQHHQELINNTNAFHRRLKTEVIPKHIPGDADSFLKQCRRKISATGGYRKKQIGLQIIHSARRWAESYVGASVPCSFEFP